MLCQTLQKEPWQRDEHTHRTLPKDFQNQQDKTFQRKTSRRISQVSVQFQVLQYINKKKKKKKAKEIFKWGQFVRREDV
ncbi:hypothetical protein JOB18_022400 [Solea senegalensis]|nr:hypothetical protein JOB18_022400 [Solea senegalensis]